MAPKNRIQQIDIASRDGYDAIFNASYLEDIPAALDEWRCSRILLVASKSLAANTDRVAALQSLLRPKVVDTKLGVGSHSPYEDVRDIAARISEHKADCVVSLGSSSYSDACKIARTLQANLPAGFSISDMEALVDQNRGVADSYNGEPLKPATTKLIVVPTSLSASEWNAVGSATNLQGKKQHFGHWHIGHPDLILMDPKLASTSPELLWLSSGVRCVDHCVETMCNPKSGEPGLEGVNEHAEKGLTCMIKGLTEYKAAKATAMNDAEKALLLEGISECQYGSREALMGLLIWSVAMGPSHAIGHQLGSVAKVMHGVTSCILLPPVLRWQAAHQKDSHTAAAQANVLRIFNDTLGWQETSAGDAINKFVASLDLPTTLKAVGVTSDEAVSAVAEKTLTDIWGGGKRQMEYKDIMEILNSVRE